MDAELSDLGKREGLPDALKVLLNEYPRDIWQAHPGFDGLIRFWLERHMMFRRLMDVLTAETQKRLDKEVDARAYQASVSRFGSMLVGDLHGHHNIEDMHYFPVLAKLDTRVSRGFDILDRDHHALDDILYRYVEAANAVINADAQSTRETAKFLDETQSLEALLSRHLIDEEELVVPVILKHGANGLG
ncbi:hemerythrin domain-containing protein [Actibacterium pelagium]|uniref:Cation-binding protein n=1 Tax=Actibacterium pelagium TaxID=2029103 RepID=A0A917EKE3_9RHOB|nr:hemerythrin domain-containing protein [Actibacterium pelagium]GGE48726.1 cation-binding protein [Actibacterium pelagium]